MTLEVGVDDVDFGGVICDDGSGRIFGIEESGVRLGLQNQVNNEASRNKGETDLRRGQVAGGY